MSDHSSEGVVLTWFSLSDRRLTANRWLMQQWCDQLGLPGGGLDRENVLWSYRHACATTTQYTDDEGKTRMMFAREGKTKGKVITYDVLRDDNTKLAAWQYFGPRRTERGKVAGSTRILPTYRATLSGRERAAAEQWVLAASQALEKELGEAPWNTVRRLLRAGFTLGGVPVLRRNTMFFCYADERAASDATGELIRRIDTGGDYQAMPLDERADLSIFAASADAWMHEQAAELIAAMEAWVENPDGQRKDRKTALSVWRKEITTLRQRTELHERRLSHDLPQTHETLHIATEMMAALHPTGGLQSATS